MEKSNNFWKAAAIFLFGVIIGFTFAPMKNGVHVKVMNNGNTGALDGDYDELDDDYDDYYEEDFDDCDDECQKDLKF